MRFTSTLALLVVTVATAACDPTPGGCFVRCSEDGGTLGGSSFSNQCSTDATAESCEETAVAFCEAAGLPLTDFAYSAECACDDACSPELDD